MALNGGNKRKSKDWRLLVLLLAVIAVVCAVVLIISSRKKNMIPQNSEIMESENENTEGNESATESEMESEASEVMSETTEAESESEIQSEVEFERTEDSSNGGNGQNNGGQSSKPANSKPQNTKPEKPVVSFPYKVAGTGLVINEVSAYQGIFLEDGSDSEINNVGAIIVKNTGSVDVEYARIELSKDSQTYTYVLSDIPSGATIVGQEIDKKAAPSGTYDNCQVEISENKLEQSSGRVKVTELEDGSLEVANLTGSKIPCVRVFYKFYLESEKAFLGGITYTSKIVDLDANGKTVIIPEHYAAGYSKVVMVRTYDTAD